MSMLLDGKNTAGFRAWGSAVSNSLSEIGLIKTIDTGQIDWTTVEYTAGSFSGYEIWRFNDVLQATVPIFLKITYGSGSGGPIMIKTQVGQGTDGAGVLTGALVSQEFNPSVSWMGGLGTFPSYFSYHSGMGFLGVHCFLGFEAYNQTAFSFMIARSCDDDGVPNGEGYTFFSRETAYFYSFLTNTNIASGQSYAMPVGGALSSVVGVNPQLTKCYMVTPQVRLLPALLLYVASEFSGNNTFLAKPVTTQHTYMTLGDKVIASANNTKWGIGTVAGVHLLAMVWE